MQNYAYVLLNKITHNLYFIFHISYFIVISLPQNNIIKQNKNILPIQVTNPTQQNHELHFGRNKQGDK
jgi:hypothetical protein